MSHSDHFHDFATVVMTAWTLALSNLHIKENEYAFRGNNSVPFLYISFLNWDQPSKERIRSSRSQFLPLRVDLFRKGFLLHESKTEVLKVVPLCNSGKKT